MRDNGCLVDFMNGWWVVVIDGLAIACGGLNGYFVFSI